IANDRQATIFFPLPIDVTRGLIPLPLDGNGTAQTPAGLSSAPPAAERPTPRPTPRPDFDPPA
ncbi:MAG: hypothetical protein AB7K36_21195, partial [Chloroflexota bacterium]